MKGRNSRYGWMAAAPLAPRAEYAAAAPQRSPAPREAPPLKAAAIFPIRRRADYPLLFDRKRQPKPAFFAVQEAAQAAR